MTNVIENAAEKMDDVKDDVAGVAKKQASRLEKVVKIALRTIPLLPERTFEMVLDRMGLARKPSGFALLAAFTGGFVAGGVTTALTTPLSGPALRGKVRSMMSEWMKEGIEAERTMVREAKELAKDAKHVVEEGAAKVVEAEHGVEKKLKNGSSTTREQRHS
jgi:gas vesicle protein